jgi:hypothetical protein
MLTKALASLIGVAVLTTFPSCGQHDPEIIFYTAGGYHFTRAEEDAIREIAESSLADIRRVLPGLPRTMAMRVVPYQRVSETAGEDTSFVQPNIVYWNVNPQFKGGVIGVARAQLRPALFHALHSLVRAKTIEDRTLFEFAVSFGMATVFERDFGHVREPWGEYPPEVSGWVAELVAARPDASRALMSRHPDGRRWIGPKVGTFLTDRAMAATGKSSADLVATPAAEILRLAAVR